MLRTAALSTQPYYQSLPDYGYEDGRMAKRGIRVEAHDKHSRYRQNCRRKGLCPRCGKEPAENKVLCDRCAEIKRHSYIKNYLP